MIYKLNLEDYLIYNLYVCSKNKHIIRQRKLTQFLWPFIFLAFGSIGFFLGSNVVLLIYVLIIAIVWIIFFPYFLSWRQKSHITKQIEEFYGKVVDVDNELVVNEKHVLITNSSGESKTLFSQIKNITEIDKYYFVHLAVGAIILPKREIKLAWQWGQTFIFTPKIKKQRKGKVGSNPYLYP